MASVLRFSERRESSRETVAEIRDLSLDSKAATSVLVSEARV